MEVAADEVKSLDYFQVLQVARGLSACPMLQMKAHCRRNRMNADSREIVEDVEAPRAS